MNRARPLLVSNDPDLIDDVLRLAAANGVEVHLATDADAARGRWSLAPLVLVGADVAGSVAGTRPQRRRDVVLVARTPTAEDWQRAVALGAEHVVALPEAERWLIDRLADCGEGAPRNGIILAVMSAGAGAGASTVAATLALAAAARSMRVLLIDADPFAGGLDVLLGIEEAPGIRWGELVETRGRLGAHALEQALPHASGVAVLSWGREGPAAITVEALGAVLDAGERGFDLVVVDLPRHVDAVTETVVARARLTMVVTVNHVRGTVAAARLCAALLPRAAAVACVLREDAPGVDADAVVEALGVPLVGRLPHQAALTSRADEGEPPGLRDGYGRACQALLAAATDELRQAG